VDKWDTPILVMHGEKDFRVPFEQGMAAFNAARIRDIPAEMVLFPEENHWILKPQSNIFWHRTFYAWLDKWLK
jgi:dipeptidyl aminopeptidase/acylaminoacyl peptidase